MHIYGSEIWDLNCNYVDEFGVPWRKIKQRIWRLPNIAHNAIVQNLSCNIDDQLETKIMKFIHMCLNHGTDVCRAISLSKLLKTQLFHQIIIISLVNMNCQIKIGI